MRTKQIPAIETDIVIAGGGIAGLTLAVLLADAGLKTCVVDPAAKPEKKSPLKPSGRTVALMNSSLEVIKAAGIWDDVLAASGPLHAMRIIDTSIEHQPPQENLFEATELGLAQYGYNIPNALLRECLLKKAARTKNLTLIMETAVQDYAAGQTHIKAILKNGTRVKARVIVGADGRDSVIRNIAGITVTRKEYDQTALTFLIRHSKPHHQIATEFHRPPGPLAFVPLPGDMSSVVWVERHNNAENLIRLKQNELEAHLGKLSHGRLGELKLASAVESWPLCSITAQGLIAPRAALIAEAAHVMSPITAQGLNLSLRDVAALAETLVDAARLGLDIGAHTTLKTYAGRRVIDIKSRVMGVDGFNRLVSQDLEFIKRIRRSGMRALTDSRRIKTMAMQHGLAPTLDIGRLARGEGL